MQSTLVSLATALIVTLAAFLSTSSYLLAASQFDDTKPEVHPNIIFLVADDASWRDFGIYGNKLINTPNIDQLAKNGFLSTNAFLTTPQCSPSRISMLTGLYPHSTGAEDLHMPLPQNKRILPSHLSTLGYYSGLIKKSHLGEHGNAQFDKYFANLTSFEEFIDSARGRPFFLWVGFTDPHRVYKPTDIEPPQSPNEVFVPPFLIDDEKTRKDLALYYEYIRRLDLNIGQYISTLKKRSLLDNTLIIFISDNGAPFPREKGSLYDAGIKTPWIMHWPNRIPKGVVSNELLSVIDIKPTLLKLLNLEIPEYLQGEPIKGLFQGKPEGRDFVFSERNWHNVDEHMRSVRDSRFKLIKNAYLEHPHGTAADIGKSPSFKQLLKAKNAGQLTSHQSLLFEYPRPLYELYDTLLDPFELNNLADNPAYTDTKSKLINALDAWQQQTNDFPPEQRRRKDNTSRFTGEKFDKTKLPEQIK